MGIKKQFKSITLPSQVGKVVQYAEGLKEGKYSVYILDARKGRTMRQNRYYWGVVLKVIEEDTGIEVEDLHEYFKQKFSRRTDYNIGVNLSGAFTGTEMGVEIMQGIHDVCVSTKMLSTKHFTTYIDKIVRWAGERGLRIPAPNEIPDEWAVEISNQYH